jgi:mRNA interferase MazF
VTPRGCVQAGGFRLRFTVELAGAKLPTRSWVKISRIRTRAVARIGRRIARAEFGALAHVLEGHHEIPDD